MIRSPRRGCALVFAAVAVALSGCGRAPAFNILGSFFPGWIACTCAGILLTVAIRLLLARMDLERRVRALPLLYLSLSLLFACTLWLLFFE